MLKSVGLFMVVIFVLMGVFFPQRALSCTTMIITKGASADGSMIVTHSDDNDLVDERIIFVPAMDHDAGSQRAVYCSAVAMGEFPQYACFSYPRISSTDRGPGHDVPDYPRSIPLGFIPQVSHTYAYFDGSYGIMNEHQLMFGECTDGAKLTPEPEPGKRIFYSSELSRVALERCTKARDAVKLMGSLIEEYGYYATGETLPVADPDEAWVMEMAPSPEGTGGLWVAKKVPDGEVFMAANEFRIREVDPNDPDMMFSPRLFEIAQKHGWWNPAEGKLDWLKTVSLGEYNHPYYSLRRGWRILSLIAPSQNFSPWVENGLSKDYPFSIKPDHKLTLQEIMKIHRDHYEGTEFDLTQGIAAGPYGYPDRFYGPYDGQGDVGDPKRKLEGAWERPISVTYCGFTFICQGRKELPDAIGGILWLGLDKPGDTCFIPFYAGVNSLPESFSLCDTSEFNRKSAWWAFNFVSNWAGLKYSNMHADITAMQDKYETAALRLLPAVGKTAQELYQKDEKMAREYLTTFCTQQADKTIADWWSFADQLIVRYSDGFINERGKMAQPVGY
ncbi:MAG: C69 family dipeptidase, partial [Atribacterota bacterium]